MCEYFKFPTRILKPSRTLMIGKKKSYLVLLAFETFIVNNVDLTKFLERFKQNIHRILKYIYTNKNVKITEPTPLIPVILLTASCIQIYWIKA